MRDLPSTTLAAALVALLLGPLDVGLASVALPRISADLGGGIEAGQLVVLAYVLALAAGYLPAGRLADASSPRVALGIGFAAFTLGSLGVAAAPGLGVLLAARVAQGAAAASLVTSGQAIAFAALGPSRGGRGLGLVHSAVAVGMLAGPLLGGVLLERVAWQRIFLAEIPVGLVGLVLTAAATDPGAARSSTPGRGPSRAGVARALALALVIFVAMSANMFLTPYLLQRPLALAAGEAGVLLAIVPLVILVAAVPAGTVADRRGSRGPTASGAAVVALGIGGFAASAFTRSVPLAALSLALYGLGAALFQSPNNRSALRAATPESIGTVSALLGLARQIGQAMGVVVAGGLIAATGGVERGDYVRTFLVLAAVALGVAAAALLLPEDGPATPVRAQP